VEIVLYRVLLVATGVAHLRYLVEQLTFISCRVIMGRKEWRMCITMLDQCRAKVTDSTRLKNA